MKVGLPRSHHEAKIRLSDSSQLRKLHVAVLDVKIVVSVSHFGCTFDGIKSIYLDLSGDSIMTRLKPGRIPWLFVPRVKLSGTSLSARGKLQVSHNMQWK